MTALALNSGDLENVSTLVGLAQDVRSRLECFPDERVVAVVLPHANQVSADAIAVIFRNIAHLVPLLMEDQHAQTLRRIVEALMRTFVPTPNALKEAEMSRRIHERRFAPS